MPDVELSFLDAEFDKAEVRAVRREIPDGEYLVVVRKSLIEVGGWDAVRQYDQPTQWRLDYEIQGGEYNGQKVYHRMRMTADWIGNVKSALAAMNFFEMKPSHLGAEFEHNKFLGLRLFIRLATSTSKKDGKKYQNCYVISRDGETTPAAETPQPTAAQKQAVYQQRAAQANPQVKMSTDPDSLEIGEDGIPF